MDTKSSDSSKSSSSSEDRIPQSANKSTTTIIPTHQGLSSIQIPAFYYPPSLRRINALETLTNLQAGSPDSYVVPPLTPRVPNTAHFDVLAGVAPAHLPDPSPTEHEDSNFDLDAMENLSSVTSRKQIESALGEGLHDKPVVAVMQSGFEGRSFSSTDHKEATRVSSSELHQASGH